MNPSRHPPSLTPLPDAPPAAWPADDAVLHVDDQLVVCDKPAGLLAVPGRGEGGERNLHAWLRERWPDVEIVHRLDMATSGLMVFARGQDALRRLSAEFAGRRVHKRYEAVVAGVPEGGGDWAEIDLPLACDWPRRPMQKVDFAHGRPSRTRWRCLARAGDTTRVELEPVTGRSHQLRVHLLAIGHPIVGDPLYAPPPWRSRSPRLLLHARELGVVHPATGEPMRFARAAPF